MRYDFAPPFFKKGGAVRKAEGASTFNFQLSTFN